MGLTPTGSEMRETVGVLTNYLTRRGHFSVDKNLLVAKIPEGGGEEGVSRGGGEGGLDEAQKGLP